MSALSCAISARIASAACIVSSNFVELTPAMELVTCSGFTFLLNDLDLCRHCKSLRTHRKNQGL